MTKHTTVFSSILLLHLVMVFVTGESCKNAPPLAPNEVIRISWPDTLAQPWLSTIVQPAGELPFYQLDATFAQLTLDSAKAAQFDYLPCPVNIGVLQPFHTPLQDLHTLVLATRLPVGSQVSMHLLGMCTLYLSDEEKTYILGYPTDPKLRIIQAQDYQDFSTRYDPIRTILQNYLVQKEGLGKVDRVVWQSEPFTRNYLSDRYVE